MEMEKGSASASGTVAMEISAAASAERAEPEESARQQAAFRDHRALIVIGEISTGLHLDAAKEQIAQGKRRGRWGQREARFGEEARRRETLKELTRPLQKIISVSIHFLFVHLLIYLFFLK